MESFQVPLLTLLVMASAASGLPTRARRETEQYNIVLILTDDLDVTLGGLEPLRKTKELITDKGIFFSNAFVHSPIGCPSRSSLLTGNYIHNHGATNNTLRGNCNSLSWQAGAEKRSLAVYAQEAGYKTAYVGTYLNSYGEQRAGGVHHVPPGWDRWFGLVGESKYYNYSVSKNGEEEKHGDVYSKDYFTDLVANVSSDFIDQQFKALVPKPFLLVAAPPSPHAPSTAAPQYDGFFAAQIAPRTPNWNVSSEDKHWVVREQAAMDEAVAQTSDKIHDRRWDTLLSVDDLVEKIIAQFEEVGADIATYFIFTSDNGFHLGQFCIPFDKRQPYEQDIRVPLMVRGPPERVPQNIVVNSTVLNIDIAPTLIDLMGLTPPAQMDGTSFAPLVHGPTPKNWRRDFLVDYHGEGRPPCGLPNCPPPTPQSFHSIDAVNNTYTCVRALSEDENSLYCEFTMTDFAEYYDTKTDPWQLNNAVHTLSPAVLAKKKKRLHQLRTCSGASCRQEPNRQLPKNEMKVPK